MKGNRAGMINKQFIVGIGSCVGELLFSLTAVVLPCCVCYMYLLSSLSQSYVFDIRAVRKITEGTEKPVYPSDQSRKSS